MTSPESAQWSEPLPSPTSTAPSPGGDRTSLSSALSLAADGAHRSGEARTAAERAQLQVARSDELASFDNLVDEVRCRVLAGAEALQDAHATGSSTGLRCDDLRLATPLPPVQSSSMHPIWTIRTSLPQGAIGGRSRRRAG